VPSAAQPCLDGSAPRCDREQRFRRKVNWHSGVRTHAYYTSGALDYASMPADASFAIRRCSAIPQLAESPPSLPFRPRLTRLPCARRLVLDEE
jgi:hypothetical protein